MSEFKGHPDQHYGHVSYSQHGEDLMILNVFTLLGIFQGNYLDLGAHHPTNISNTKLLYDLGWSGVNVEANPHLIDRFHVERPMDRNLNIGVGPKAGIMPFYMYDNFSGLNSLVKSEVKKHIAAPDKIDVQVLTVNEIIDKFCDGVWPQLLCMDLEGLDYSVLESAILHTLNRPRVICVESRKGDTKMQDLLWNKGYQSLCRMGENLIFIQKFDLDQLT